MMKWRKFPASRFRGKVLREPKHFLKMRRSKTSSRLTGRAITQAVDLVEDSGGVRGCRVDVVID
jgi:hypothetical protein